jgi:lysophospholipase L1-like esterase
MKRTALLLTCAGLAALLTLGASAADQRAAGPGGAWVATWAASQQLTEDSNLPPAPGFADTTLRQIVHVSIGGRRFRVRFSNAFGRSPLTLRAARVAAAGGGGACIPTTDRALTFGGRPSVTIPEGALMVSDPVDFNLAPLSDLAVTVRLTGAPAEITGHPGSRTTSYLQAGDAVSAPELSSAVRVDHWYFLSAVEVPADESPGAVAILGDSITDGRGSTTNGNDRWPDNLARRLQSAGSTKRVAVLNLGIGGNRLLRDGLGPNTLARLDRDVLAQPGVRWLIVFEGINDIGTASGARAKGQPGATAEDIIGAYEQIIERAHALGIRVYGATLMPFEGFSYADYFTPESEAERQKVNEWIRTSRRFDAVIDFDAVTRDPERPSRLSAAVDGGDHLHPSAAGYRIMADAIDLALFTAPASAGIHPAPR